jgi:hypothetical protein
MTDHYEDRLTDEHLSVCLRDAEEERYAEPMAKRRQLTDVELLVAWKENDETAEEIRNNQSAYFCTPALLEAHSRFRSRRFRDHPNLAARYYGSP